MKVELKWKKTDTILLSVLVAALIIALTYTTIRLTDPYYGPCEYQYVSSGKCQDDIAWHLQNSITDQIHKIIPYAMVTPLANADTGPTTHVHSHPIHGAAISGNADTTSKGNGGSAFVGSGGSTSSDNNPPPTNRHQNCHLTGGTTCGSAPSNNPPTTTTTPPTTLEPNKITTTNNNEINNTIPPPPPATPIVKPCVNSNGMPGELSPKSGTCIATPPPPPPPNMTGGLEQCPSSMQIGGIWMRIC
jgi:hypothetical protein